MASKTFNSRIQNKKDTSSNWTASDPVLLDGEIISVVTNDGQTRHKTGDGTKSYTQLPFDDEYVISLVNDKQDELTAGDNVTIEEIDGQLVIDAVLTEGATFVPAVSDEGIISWTNDGDLDNPSSVDIMGPQGESGVYVGADEPEDESITVWIDIDATSDSSGGTGSGEDGVTFTPSVSADGIISWTNDGGLTNPTPVNIKGTDGADGEDGLTTSITVGNSTYEVDNTGNIDLGDLATETYVSNAISTAITGALEASY